MKVIFYKIGKVLSKLKMVVLFWFLFKRFWYSIFLKIIGFNYKSYIIFLKKNLKNMI